MKTRNCKQIRERFINVLSQNINRTEFTEEEDFRIFEMSIEYSKKWTKIKNFFSGRTSDMIKSRFYSHVRKKYRHLITLEKHV